MNAFPALTGHTQRRVVKGFWFRSNKLVERDDLQIDEVKIWDYVLKWDFAQNPMLVVDPATWSDDDFRIMGATLQNLLPLIRFFGLSSKVFL